MSMRKSVVFFLVILMVIGIAPLFAGGQGEQAEEAEETEAPAREVQLELRDPDEFQAEILDKSGVPFEVHDQFAEAVAVESEPFAGDLDEPIRIGFATPSFDISDAWARW
mgnify:FL=1